MTLDLTPVSIGTLSIGAVSPSAAGLNGPDQIGDVPVWDGSGWDFNRFLTLTAAASGYALRLVSGDAVVSHAGSHTTAAGTTVFEFDSEGGLKLGSNLLADTSNISAGIWDFFWNPERLRLYTRNVICREMGDPSEIRLGRAGNDNDYPYGDPQGDMYGVLSGQVLGTLMFEGTATPVGGTPGTTTGAEFRTWSAGVRAKAAEDFMRGASNDSLGGSLEFLTTPTGSDTQAIRLTIAADGKTTFAENIQPQKNLVFQGTSSLISMKTATSASSSMLEARAAADSQNRLTVSYAGTFEWGGGSGSADVTLSRDAADVLALGSGDGLQFGEAASDLSAPGVNRVRVYAKDNGAGKTQLVARFNSGAVQVIVAEP